MSLIQHISIRSILVAALALACYWQTGDFEFAYDDVLQIKYNSLVTEPSSNPVEAYGAIFLYPTPPGNLYRPLTLGSYRAQYEISGLHPQPYHYFNALLYASICVLVMLFLTPVLSDRWAFVASVLFTVHPVHVEAVANVIGRAELLAAFYGILACMSLRQVLEEKSVSKRGAFAIISVIAFLLACFSKESALIFIVLAPLYALYGRAELSKSIKSICLVLGSYVVSAWLVLLLRHCALGPSFFIKSDGVTVYAENPIFHLPLSERLIPALRVLGEYLKILIFPLHLSADYSDMPGPFLADTYSIVGLSALALFLGLLVLAYYYRRGPVGFSVLWFLASFALTSNVLTTIGTIMGERLAFVPSIGIVALIAYGLSLLYRRYKRASAIVTLVFFAFFLVRTLERIPIWKNNDVLFHQTLKDAPQSPKARYNLASHLYQIDKFDPNARKLLLEAVRLHPKHLFSLRLLADMALDRGKVEELEHWYKRVLEVDPDDQQVKSYLEELAIFREKFIASPKEK